MPSISRIGPKLALCGVVAGLFLVGWAARYSAAQNAAQDAPPAIDQAPGTTVKGEEPKGALPQVKPETRSDLALPLPEPGPADRLAVPHLNASTDATPFTAKPGTDAPAPVAVAPGDATTESDDPEKVATAFLEQNQKLAEAHLKTLKEEAEKLKARLQKVEAGIKRWDSLLGALKQSQRATASASPTAADEALPADDVLTRTLPSKAKAFRAVDAAELRPVGPPPPARSRPESLDSPAKAGDAPPPGALR